MRRLFALTAAALLTFVVACGGGSSPKQADDSNAPVASATPYAVLPNVILVTGNGSGGGTSGNTGGTNGGGAGTSGGATNEVKYVVQSGDTLLALANRYGTSVEAIMTRNNIASAADLRAGQEIVIPSGSSSVATPTATPARTATPASTATAVATPRPTGTATATGTATGGQRYTVQSGDLAGSIAARFGVTLDQLAAANNRTVQSLDQLNVGDVLIIPGR
ncbi:MAG: LysM peptidoglycan-binding domain-containing protein [Dehalococcoidia bacterium]|nr:LysM peptidoglycan-binding domain-containing protein [Dehalococcoidia bacterium]HRC62256.1 LysM peptidoglycan-binding domain-containing protein [Dehalococcoidia bacterium]